MTSRAGHFSTRYASIAALCALTFGAGCSPVTRSHAATPGAAAGRNAPPEKPLNVDAFASAAGGKAEMSGNVAKVSFPRSDVSIEVDGWAMPPFMGLTSWAAISPASKPGVDAMIMGDVVVFEDEVGPAMSAALDNGLEVTALHNHFFFDRPHVYFMHIGGEGSARQLGGAVHAVLEAQHEVRQASPKPRERSASAPALSPSHIDAAKLDALLGVHGTSKDGMYKAVMGRSTKAACGCEAGKAMGVNTWAAFAGTDDDALVDGDFAVGETELQPVLKALRKGRVEVMAIHHHMIGESPRMLFLHYWGRGRAGDLAATVRRALDLTAWDGRASST